MDALRRICAEIGFTAVQTYVASGNVVFDWTGPATEAQTLLEARLAHDAGKAIDVMIRDADEMTRILADDPFAGAPGNAVVTIFLAAPPALDSLDMATGANGELMARGTQEIYVHYVNGQGGSKLRIPAAARGTARNMNTVRALAALVKERGDGR